MTAVLKPSPALTAASHGEYNTALKELVRRYANTAGLRRLTFFAQPDVFGQVRWVFRGLEGRPPNYGLITIAGSAPLTFQHSKLVVRNFPIAFGKALQTGHK